MVVPLSLDHVLSLSYLQIIAGTYNSSEAHHGKGPMDGIGGTIKNI